MNTGKTVILEEGMTLHALEASGRVPVLTRHDEDPAYNSEGYIMSVDQLRFNGEPFPWLTVGPYVITVSDDNVATLRVDIVVTLPRGGA